MNNYGYTINNSILIYHDDGTFADYSHIKYKGSKVKVGDRVEKGKFIAESGNIGWSTAPHLHFSVFKQKIKGQETIKTKFKVAAKEVYLKEKEFYLKD